MPYYVTCPECGANLDPGEVCDCVKTAQAAAADGKPDRTDGTQASDVLVYCY